MIITHDIPWDKCLSKQLFPAIKKGWKDTPMKPIHFFWGLGANNLKEIAAVKEKQEEWWYVDVGYITEQITRYPTPAINNYDKTYFRIVKGNMHMTNGIPTDGSRHKKLINQGIDAEFKGWNSGECSNILLAPSSQTVCIYTHGVSQEDWIKQVGEDIRKQTDKLIKMRNKPRPNNEWWGTDIKDDLKDCHCLVTNMSLAAVDAVLNKVPVFTHSKNVCYPLSGRIKDIEKRLMRSRKEMTTWLNCVANNQFTIQEIEDGVAFDTLKKQYEIQI